MMDYARGYAETPSGNYRYDVNQDLANFLRGFVFGKNAYPEAVNYWSLPPEER
jgi:hypothetical protein